MKNKKQRTGLIVFIAIITFAIICGIYKLLASDNNSEPNLKNQTIVFTKPAKNYIAALYIEGVIQEENQTYNQEWLLDTIKTLKNDRKNMGIAVFMDSPGGAVYEADEAYLALQDYKTTGKPVYVYQGKLSASGGYYISCAAKKIYANRNTLTGSIGVITGSSYDFTGFFEKLGIKSETIHSGKNKNMFSVNEPVTEEQRKIMQSISDECYEQFTSIVAMSRNIPINDVKTLADGRIYTANQALKNGLIDAVDSWENMIKNMSENEFDGKKYKVVDFKYEKSMNVYDFLMGKISSAAPTAKLLKGIAQEATLQYPAYLYVR